MDKFGFKNPSEYLNDGTDDESIFVTQKLPEYQPVNVSGDSFDFSGLFDENLSNLERCGDVHVDRNIHTLNEDLSSKIDDVSGLEEVK